MAKLSALTPLPGGLQAGDEIYVVRGDGGSPETFASYRVDVDALLSGTAGSVSVRAATTANITIATALNNGDSLDGVTLATDDLVLVKNQAAAEENGVYVVGASPARAAGFDTYNEHPGALISVQEGTTNADTLWLCTSNVGGTLNTTAITFDQFQEETGGGGDGWVIQRGPLDNEAPDANYATIDTRNSRPVLDFDAATQEAALWTFTLPPSYGGGGLTVSLWCSLSTAITGNVGWDIAIERIDASGLDTDTDSFATAQVVTAVAVPGTSGQVLKMTVNIANGAAMDNLAAGEMGRIRVRRDVSIGSNAAGDAELHRLMIVEQ